MKLVFRDSNNEEYFLGNIKEDNDAFNIISNFLNERDYKPYYYRIFTDVDGSRVVDFGSYSEFFYLIDEK